MLSFSTKIIITVCLDVRNISDGKGNYMDEDTRNSNDIALELARLHILRGIEFTLEWNPDAGQILIFKGNKMLVVTRRTLDASNFIATFTRLYNK